MSAVNPNSTPEGATSPPPPPPPADTRTLYPEGEPASPSPPPPAGDLASPPPPPPAPSNPLGEEPGEAEAGDPAPAPKEGLETEVTERAAAYDLKLPEGFKVDETELASFRKLAAEANLPNEQAQSLIDLYVGNFKKLAEAQTAAATESWNQTLSTWKDEVAKDPVLGGVNQEAAQRTIANAMNQYGSKEARQAFDLTGAGQNPHIIRFIHKMAKALGEGKPVLPTSPGQKRSRSLYGNPET